MDGPPPPPPPHGSNPGSGPGPNDANGGYRKATDLPEGPYDIFVIPPHSAGSGFLYLPSLQCHRNSFLAGVAATLLGVALYVLLLPVLKKWVQTMVASGGTGVFALVVGVAVLSWAFGRTQLESKGPETRGTGRNSSANGNGHGGPQGGPAGSSGPGAGQQYQNYGRQYPGGGFTGGPNAGQQYPGGQYAGGQYQYSQQAPPPPGPEPQPQGDKPGEGAGAGAGASNSKTQTDWEKAREETKRKEDIRRKMEEFRKKREEEEREKQKQREKEAREREFRERREKREKERAEKEAAEKEAAAKAAKEKAREEAAARFAAAREAAAAKRAAEKLAEKLGETASKPSGGSNVSSTPNSARVPKTPSPQKRPPFPSAKTEAEDDAYSFRPYDRPKSGIHKPASASSVFSESSYAASQSTARTTPPPSRRGPYSTKDPDKIVIRGVYLFNNTFMKTPVGQLVSGKGSVTDGLILRITTEGMFIDDDVRGVPQREWDIKAWTMKLVEVWCPLLGANTPSNQSPKKINPFRFGTSNSQKIPSSEESDAYLANLLKTCKNQCRLGATSSKSGLNGSNIDGDNINIQTAEAHGFHVIRASIRDQEGKKFVFVLQETESWKVAVGLQRLRKGSQVRALGVCGLPVNETNAILENLGAV